jgi:hypothetical protein
MSRNLINVIVGSFIAVVFGIAGCGGGGESTATPTQTPATVFNTSKYTTLATGPVISFNLTGTDTAGGSYTGSLSETVDGPVAFETINTIKKRTLLTLNKTGVGNVLDAVATSYFRQSDSSLYKIVYNNGVTAVPTVYNAIPATVKIGDSGAGSTLSYSNGAIITGTWQVQDGGNGLAKVIKIANSNTGLSEQDSVFIDAAGEIISAELKIYNFPTSGVTTTLTAS